MIFLQNGGSRFEISSVLKQYKIFGCLTAKQPQFCNTVCPHYNKRMKLVHYIMLSIKTRSQLVCNYSQKSIHPFRPSSLSFIYFYQSFAESQPPQPYPKSLCLLQFVIVRSRTQLEMDFFINLLSCGQERTHSRAPLCLPRFCHFRNQKQRQQVENPTQRVDNQMTRTTSISSKPMSQINLNSIKQTPKTKFMIHNERIVKEARTIDCGFLVGVIGNTRRGQELLGKGCHLVRIGQKEQITSLRSIRPYSLDHLVVFWGQLNSQFSLGQVMCASQKLSLVLESWSDLQGVLRGCEQGLLKGKGEFCLNQSGNRICFNIITVQNKYVLQFLDASHFHSHLTKAIKDIVGLELDPTRFDLLLQKLTLRDFVDLRKQASQTLRKLQHYLGEIEREIFELEHTKPEEIELEVMECELPLVQLNQDCQSVRKSSSEQIQKQAEFFAQKQRERQAIVNEDDRANKDLEIFYFGNESNNTESNEQSQKVTIRNVNFFRKIRSKSEDATYVPDECLDDEFFQKY